jgi:deoxyribose-phosphate aldolase
MNITNEELVKYIDHTLLKPEAREDDILKLCREARLYGFKAVCVQPCYVSTAVKALEGSGVAVAVVIGFPMGANTPEVKAFETEKSLLAGARELDMVINVGALKDRKLDLVRQDIRGVVEKAAARPGVLVKVIIETCLLTDEEKVLACQAALAGGAHFVKTSTGFGGGGATEEDVRLMAQTVAGRAKIKASGGIRTREQALKMIAAGANRLGTSNGAAIING